MSNMVLLFSHQLTPAQSKDARDSLGVETCIAMPDPIGRIWSHIPPEVEDIRPLIAPVWEWVKEVSQRGDFVLIQGDFGASCVMANTCYQNERIPLYATTHRKIKEEIHHNTVTKTSYFEHVRFRKYFQSLSQE